MIAIIDTPRPAQPVDRFGFIVAGWVWLGAQQAAVTAVEVWSGETLLGETPVLLPRPDVAAAQGLPAETRTGFEVVAQHAAAGRGATIPLSLRVRLADGARTPALAAAAVTAHGAGEQVSRLSAPEPLPADAGPTVPLPPDSLQIRQVAGVWGSRFYEAGGEILAELAQAFRAAGRPLETAGAVLDFGCGCGRVLRNFSRLPHTGALWGCDLDAEAIAWNQVHLGHLARFRANAALPPTAFAPGQFDAIYAISVFTHLPEELQFAWLAELRRILRPGGVLVASVHGGHYAAESPPDVRIEVATRGFAYRRGTPTPGLPDFYMATFHSETYLRQRWGTFFEVLTVWEKHIHGVHDAVILRRLAD